MLLNWDAGLALGAAITGIASPLALTPLYRCPDGAYNQGGGDGGPEITLGALGDVTAGGGGWGVCP